MGNTQGVVAVHSDLFLAPISSPSHSLFICPSIFHFLSLLNFCLNDHDSDEQTVDGNPSKYNLLLYAAALDLEDNRLASINFLLIDTHMNTEKLPAVRVY